MPRGQPYYVINCLSQGWAVAGPSEDPLDRADLEMVQWGMGEQAAVELREKLNREAGQPAKLQHKHD